MAEATEETAIVLTQEGYELKRKRLEEYKRLLHEELPKSLKLAKEHGAELRENSEYLDLKARQEYLDAEVRKLEELLEKAKIISDKEISTKEIGIGARVTLKNLDTGELTTFTLVSPAEADPEQNRISTGSPVGRALMGQRKGGAITVETPSGKVLRYKVVGIQRG